MKELLLRAKELVDKADFHTTITLHPREDKLPEVRTLAKELGYIPSNTSTDFASYRYTRSNGSYVGVFDSQLNFTTKDKEVPAND